MKMHIEGQEDRLDRLDELLSHLSSDDGREVQSHMLGALSCFVDDETWGKCLRATAAYMSATDA